MCENRTLIMKNISIFVLFITLIACKNENAQPTTTVTDLLEQVKTDVAFLADDKLEGRETGTKGEKLAADYIAKRFKELGLQPKGTNGYFQDFNFTPKAHPHAKVKYTDTVTDKSITGRNVLGFIDNKAEKTIVIGAHYDHLGYGIEGSLYKGKEKQVHNGADDNASGVAILLQLAKMLQHTNSNNNYLLMSFSGEEMGLLGSNYFVKNATISTKNINYMINMDMVGRLKKDSTLAIYGVGTNPNFKQIIEASNHKFHLVEKLSGVGPSDHTSFYLSDIPVLHFFTGQHTDYHKPTDDIDKLNYKGMLTITNYVYDIITDLNDNGNLVFKKTKNETSKGRNFKVTLGIVPDYLFEGKGMRIDGTNEGKPAQNAGILKGDVVIQIGDIKVAGMRDYMKVLNAFNKGDKTTVIVKRNGNELALPLTF